MEQPEPSQARKPINEHVLGQENNHDRNLHRTLEQLGAGPTCAQFIEFSHVLNKRQRVEFFQHITMRLLGHAPATKGSGRGVIERGLYRELEEMLANPDLLATCSQHPEIARDVTERFLNTISTAARKAMISYPFQDEEARFLKHQKQDASSFLRDHEKLNAFLSNIYAKGEMNLPFYAKAARELNEHVRRLSEPAHRDAYPRAVKGKTRDESKTLLFTGIETGAELAETISGFKGELLKDWGGNLEKKKQDHVLAAIDAARAALCKEWYEQIEKFKKMAKILEPFSQELGRFWDLSKGNWNEVGFDILEHYAALLEKDEALKKLAEMLGRMHEAEKEIEEQEVEIEKIRYSREIDHSQKSEIVSVHESDDINHCLPQDLAMLGHPETEVLFYLKFAEKKLLTYQLVDRASVEEHFAERELGWVPVGKKKGPIIICVDTSGSMHGTPETIAKTLCFALLRIALLENRRCFLISFSTSIETLELTNFNKSYDSLIRFLSHSFHGGTDATPALDESLRQVKTKHYKKADILMISDFIMGEVDKKLVSQIERAKDQGTKFHSLVVSRVSNPSTLDMFDNQWVYDPDNRAVLSQAARDLRTGFR